MTKAPQGLLRAPNANVEEYVKKAFELNQSPAVCLWTETGCTVFVTADAEKVAAAGQAPTQANLFCEELEGVPLIWLEVHLGNEEHGGMITVFLDILDEQAVACLDALYYQQWIPVHLYDDQLNYGGCSPAPWSREDAKKAQTSVSWAREVLQRTGGGDFEQARTMINPAAKPQ